MIDPVCRRWKLALIASACLLVVLTAMRPAGAELRIDITRGSVEPLPIAVTSFLGGTPEETHFGRDIAGVVAADLERSGLGTFFCCACETIANARALEPF